VAGGERQGDPLPFPILIGDIGGTNARFALLTDANAPTLPLARARTTDYATFDDAVAATLGEGDVLPRSALLAVAAPIAGDEVPLTNCPWVIAPNRLIDRFGLSDLALLNDFEAQALSLPELRGEDIDLIGDGAMTADGPRMVVGPGTGLGAAGLVRARGMWVPIPGQGGHLDLAPLSERDFALWPHIERPHGRIEGETVISGSGLLRLYRAICATDGIEPRHATPEAVTDAALAAHDREAREAVDLFATYLGRYAGDLALVFLPSGGVYLGGGIPRKIAPVLKAGGFRKAFVAKPPHGELLSGYATAIITRHDVALTGVAAFARAPERFGVDLGGRRWRRG